MTISFNTIPSNIRVPLAYVEFDSSRAVTGTPAMPYRVLFIGQKLDTGSAEELTLVQVPTADSAIELFGAGSMLARMIQQFKRTNRSIDCWAIAFDDEERLSQATGTITLSSDSEIDPIRGEIALYIGGDRINMMAVGGDEWFSTPSGIAIMIAESINYDPGLLVTATYEGSEVTLYARQGGVAGNEIDIRMNYYSGDKTPEHLNVSIANMEGGSGTPDLKYAIAAIGDEWFQAIVTPYNDYANLKTLEEELADRWGGTRQIDGMAFCAIRGTFSEAGEFGIFKNSPFVCCMGTGESPQPSYIWASAVAAQATMSLSIDPARPLQTLAMPGILPPAVTDRWMLLERDLLLKYGISTWYVDAGGMVRIERLVTMYQKNAYGMPDPSYLDVTTPATLSWLRYSLRARITSKFPRMKLADDGMEYSPGQAIVTPKTIRAEIIALAEEWAKAGLVENLDQFRAELVVERNANDRNRVDVLCPPDLVNQFVIFAAQIQFIL